MLKGKNILVGVTGGIACYKACEIVSRLKKEDANVDVIMTKNATEFVSCLTFETLSARPVACDMFAQKTHWEVEHISLAKKADLCLIVPASANIIAKMACGIADDMLSTTLLAVRSPIVVCPSMNTNMYNNSVTQENINKLKNRGIKFVNPEHGKLACGDVGTGRLACIDEIIKAVHESLNEKKDFENKNFLITAGATQENIDGVRFISNRSSGKMGLALAKAAAKRGGNVKLIVGNITESIPEYITQVTKVITTQDMYKAVMDNLSDSDIIIKAAAPSDYCVKNKFDNKIKDKSLTLELEKNVDIAAEVGKIKNDKKLIVFCAETTDLIDNANKKIKQKNADMIVANDVTKSGAGFEVDTNIATIITKDNKSIDCQLMSKYDLADVVLDEINKL